jgi:hypothetical protein
VIDFRLYRLAFLPSLVTVVVALFSLQPVPEPLRAPVSLGGFDGDAAAGTAREIVEIAPARTPGSEGDVAATDLVTERFGEIGAAEVSEQSFSASFDGEDVELRNVIATLPGDSERRLVLLAPRDSAVGPGAASSAAATGALLEIAQSFGAASHSKTLVFVSTAGGLDGATGLREFAEHYPERDLIDSALVISQPGARDPEPPFVIPWSIGRQSTAIQLTRTAAATVSAELERPAGLEGTLGELLHLALPTGLGEQGPLIERGIDAVALSAAGERPLPPSQDGPSSLSEGTLTRIGQAAQTMLLALDAIPGEPEHGPDTYVSASDNLVPGWSIALLAFTLLLPAGVAAVDGFARSLRRGGARPIDLGWVIGRSLPFLGVLVLTYLLAILGLLPRPRFPYDPDRFSVDLGGAVALVLLIGAFAAAWVAMRPLGVPRRGEAEGLATVIGLVLSVTALAVWLLNPYLSLLAVPATHAWLAATAPDQRRLAATAAAVGASLVPLLVAMVWLAGRLEVGIAVPWQVLLMVGGGHLGPALALLGGVGAGCLVALLAAALGPTEPAPEPRISVRGPSSPVSEESGEPSPAAGELEERPTGRPRRGGH